jgi:DNA-binding transcriptional MerR regulator
MSTENRLLPARAVRARYDVCAKTIDRWIEQGVLSEPVRINGRRYWYEHTLEKLERASVGSRSNTTDTEIKPQALPSSR